MKWLISLVLALCLVTPAMADEGPYISIVGNDIDAENFYLSPDYKQFLYDQDNLGVPVCKGTFPEAYNGDKLGCEQFRSQTPVDQPEICDTQGIQGQGNVSSDRGLKNAVTRAGSSGWYEWYIRLPTNPSGEINLVLRCGVLKPRPVGGKGYRDVELCAAETGERIGPGLCARQEINPGSNPLVVGALPKISAIAYPGPYNDFVPFNLTAFRNPGTYNPFNSGLLLNNQAGQLLNGKDNGTRILLKSCMDKTVVVKLPVTGQVNAASQEETNLKAGDIIYVRIDIPRANTVDVYCHEQSLKVMGIGDVPQASSSN